ncbi:EpsG family protein [Vibrio campbellii]|uniref:EpsG family protein n=1 Tax=Vibrio campbellii TaxID=680 RepID=A0AAE9MZD1_9VIBR|nr:EpsG family protein [Vibrio campbellii]UTZ26434.1 EpsG family protein [Vibrio campbellii]
MLFLFLFFILVLGFRGTDSGNDTQSYINMFHDISQGNPGSFVFQSKEYLYIKSTELILFLGGGFREYLIFSAFLMFVPILYVLKKTNSINVLTVSAFLALGPFFFFHSGIRQAIAISFFSLSTLFLIQGLKFRSALFFVIAANFHISVILACPFLLAIRWKYNKWLYYFILTFSFLVSFRPQLLVNIILFASSIIPEKYRVFLTEGLSYNSTSLGIKSIFVFMLGLMLVFCLSKESNKIRTYIFNLSFLYVVLYNFLGNVLILSRVPIYYVVFFVVSLSFVFDYFSVRAQYFIKYAVFICFFVFYIRALFTDPYGVMVG